jgi:hypothetical protein
LINRSIDTQSIHQSNLIPNPKYGAPDDLIAIHVFSYLILK